ncbi:GNAT family N-acetyltransferase [Streptococcus hyointestinalis]|uniref:GNAT family N-acetyltransferase n=1 Tax=Streptococcus hyointestinalis TaxID=1337 RepID=UPI003F9AD245
MKEAKEVIVKVAEPGDADALVKLLECVRLESDFITEDSQEQLTKSEMETFISSSQLHDNCLCLLAMLDDEAIAVLNVAGKQDYSVSHIGDIFLAVKKSYWGCGLGQLLLAEAIDWAEHSGVIRRLELTVQKRNQAALHIYQKHGFLLEGIKKRGARAQTGDFLDVCMMSKMIEGN